MRDPFHGYDQWKTASPYDDEAPCEICGIDPADCQCPECPVCEALGQFREGDISCLNHDPLDVGSDAPYRWAEILPRYENFKANIRAILNHPVGHRAALALMDELGADDLYSVYRSVYKYTDCGPSIGFLVRYTIEQDNGESGPGHVDDETVVRWIYCDDLRRGLPGTPYRLTREFLGGDYPDVHVLGVSVGSIVEGVDQECQTIVLEGAEFTPEAFWQAVEDVSKEADEIWKATHGCAGCAKKQMEFTGLDTAFNEYGDAVELDDDGNPMDYLPVHPDCEVCGGEGMPI